MLLKRHYILPDGWVAQMNTRDISGNLPDSTRAEGVLLNPLPVDHLSVIHTGVTPAQHFSRRFVDAGLAEGWISLSRGVLILHTTQADLQYTITAMPGRYCLHCSEHYATDPTGSEMRAHIAATHPGAVVLNPHWPAGYRVVEGYECLLAEEQHTQWQRPAYATVSHSRYKG